MLSYLKEDSQIHRAPLFPLFLFSLLHLPSTNPPSSVIQTVISINKSSFERHSNGPLDSDKKSRISNLGTWAMNIINSVGIIMVNKQVMSSSSYNFRFATTLTGFHFTVTALVGWILNATRYSALKHVPLWDLLWFSIVANLSITGMNFSLMLNSVGFYQIWKFSMIPVVCVMEWILHNKNYSGRVMMAVFVVALGVGVCMVTDVDINLKGFLCAFVAVFCSSLQQIVLFEEMCQVSEATKLDLVIFVMDSSIGQATFDQAQAPL